MGQNQDIDIDIEVKEGYYSDGQLNYRFQFLNGDKHGEQLIYFRNGKLSDKEQFVNGKRHGEQLSYWSHIELYKSYYINDYQVPYEEWIKYNRNIKLQSIWEKIK